VRVSLDRVEKELGGRPVIRPTTLELDDGARVALIGPSGSGKSTLLRMVLGLVVPDRGTVKVGDTAVNARTARAVRRRIGYVIQDGGLFPHLTAAENVALPTRIRDGADDARGRGGAREKLRELAELVRLPEALLGRYPRSLSGGERQRVGVMRALVLDPAVLLLDEPLGALDPIVRAGLQEDLLALFRRLGKSVVLVTHDMAEAAYLADSIAIMRDGAILQRGTMRELIDAPEHPFVGEFVGAERKLAGALA